MKDSWSLAIPIQHSNEQSVSYVALLTQAAWRSGSFGEPRLWSDSLSMQSNCCSVRSKQACGGADSLPHFRRGVADQLHHFASDGFGHTITTASQNQQSPRRESIL